MLGSSERAVKPERMPHELLVRKHDRVRGNWYFGGRAGVVISTGYPSCMIILIRLSVLLVHLHRLFSTSQVRLATYDLRRSTGYLRRSTCYLLLTTYFHNGVKKCRNGLHKTSFSGPRL